MPSLTGLIPAATGVLGFFGAKRGNNLVIAGLRQVQEGISAASNFNSRIDQINTNRELDNLSKEITRLTASNRASLSVTGIDLGSQSSLAVLNDTLATFERVAADTLSSQQIRAQAREFETAQQRFGIETQISQTRQQQVQRNRQAALAIAQAGLGLL